jgi:hypothetical protein
MMRDRFMLKGFKFVGAFAGAALVVGCAGMAPASKDVQRTFTYDYSAADVSREELWVRARDYFATTFGDSRSVLRVQDKEETTLIGKGVASWKLIGSERCFNDYHLKFMSKDGRARLELELIEGVPSYSTCSGWPWPSQSGYEEIVSGFESFSAGLGGALNKESSFSDF